MNPYEMAIATLVEQASTSEANAPIHEAEGNHAQGAIARMTAASCRAAIAVLQAAPAEQPKGYTWADVKGYSVTTVAVDLDPNKSRWFLTMKDGLTFVVDEGGRHDDEAALQQALMAAVNQQTGS